MLSRATSRVQAALSFVAVAVMLCGAGPVRAQAAAATGEQPQTDSVGTLAAAVGEVARLDEEYLDRTARLESLRAAIAAAPDAESQVAALDEVEAAADDLYARQLGLLRQRFGAEEIDRARGVLRQARAEQAAADGRDAGAGDAKRVDPDAPRKTDGPVKRGIPDDSDTTPPPVDEKERGGRPKDIRPKTAEAGDEVDPKNRGKAEDRDEADDRDEDEDRGRGRGNEGRDRGNEGDRGRGNEERGRSDEARGEGDRGRGREGDERGDIGHDDEGAEIEREYEREMAQIEAEYRRESDQIEREAERELDEAEREGRSEKAAEARARTEEKRAVLRERHERKLADRKRWKEAKEREMMDRGQVTICWSPPGQPEARRTKRVGRAAVEHFLDMGATLGPCEGQSPEVPPVDDGERLDVKDVVRTPPIVGGAGDTPLPGELPTVPEDLLDEVLRRLPGGEEIKRATDVFKNTGRPPTAEEARDILEQTRSRVLDELRAVGG